MGQGAGRPTKCTEQVRREFCEALELWGTMEDASEYSGISVSTAYQWIQQGRARTHASRVDFCRRVAQARVRRRIRAKGELFQRGTVGRRVTHYARDGSVSRVVEDPPDWRPLAWLLERESPESNAVHSPLFMLAHLRRLARTDTTGDGAWQHLCDVVARSLATLKPFGAAAERPAEEVDEAELAAELEQRGMDRRAVDQALQFLRAVRSNGQAQLPAPSKPDEKKQDHADEGDTGTGEAGHRTQPTKDGSGNSEPGTRLL